MNIENMTKEELLDFCKGYNIFRSYDFPEFIETKNKVLQRLNQLGMSTDDIQIPRVYNGDTKVIRRMI